jgi:hypothetical protein
MKKMNLEWYPVSGMFATEEVEMGTRSEVSTVYRSFPSEVRSYEGTGKVRDRVNHCYINVHVVSVPNGEGGTRLLVYPTTKQ